MLMADGRLLMQSRICRLGVARLEASGYNRLLRSGSVCELLLTGGLLLTQVAQPAQAFVLIFSFLEVEFPAKVREAVQVVPVVSLSLIERYFQILGFVEYLYLCSFIFLTNF